MKLIRIFLFLSCMAVLCGCKKSDKKDESRVPYLEIKGKYLYLDEIQSVVPKGCSRQDSLSIVNNYVRKWVTDALVYDHAERNISNQDEIEDLVEDYRKSLIIHQYQQNLIKEKLGDGPTDEQMLDFYNQNKDKFQLTNNIVKGIFIKVPLGAPKYANLQNWLRNFNAKSVETVEKYSIQNATNYQYFGDKWTLFNDVVKDIPIKIEDQANFISRNKYIEVSDSRYHYIIRILSCQLSGSIEPYEMAKDKIQTILMNKLKNDFIQKFEDKLYQDAVKGKKVTYYKNEK
ncbi:MAG: peptidylprolyl isomerase [Paludibacteraceae bacterium]|nr:peptidylprolyl isomerase [Paludibacteraceae bacterium]